MWWHNSMWLEEEERQPDELLSKNRDPIVKS